MRKASAKYSIVTTMIVCAFMLVLTVYVDLTTIEVEHAEADLIRLMSRSSKADSDISSFSHVSSLMHVNSEDHPSQIINT